MSIPGSTNPLLLASAAAAGGYEIERSLRFNSADSAYLSRTPAAAGNRKTWTWAGWVKRASLAVDGQTLFSRQTAANDASTFYVQFNADRLAASTYNSGWLATTQVFRDVSSWYHIVVVLDTTQATSTDRFNFYINGSLVTQFATDQRSAISLNSDLPWNDAALHEMGRLSAGVGGYSNLYLADIHFIDGQALTPSSFTEVSATTGQLVPIEYTGTYGTNGFHLDFADNASTTTIGYDAAGSNDWTANNLSVTAGDGNDSLVDTPTSYGTDTGAGGEVRGNYATLNALVNPGGSTLSNGNLDCTAATGAPNAGRVVGTIAVSSGKWYWECVRTGGAGSGLLGIALSSEFTSIEPGRNSTSYGYYGETGEKYNSASLTGYGASWTTNDVVGVALDLDAGTLVFYKNGASQGTAFSSLSGSFVPAFSSDTVSSTSFSVNFGQRAFAYTAPSGFKALCDTNLPAPLVALPNTVMDVKLYTGNGGTQTISGLGFSPDLVWIKNRAAADNHKLTDTVRGATEELESNTTDAEATNADGLTQFNADGFDLGADDEYNTSSEAYVGWAWDAGSSTVTNTQGSISSQVRANASAGFSVVTYTGTGSSATVGHGCGTAPKFFIIKCRNTASSWIAWHTGIGSTDILRLESTNAKQTIAGFWQGTNPSSTILYLDADGTVNASGNTYVAYCFAPVDGYSSFSSYTGNGSADGPFVYLGFRPAMVMVKMSSSTGNWTILDDKREGYNVDNDPLFPNLSNAEGTTDLIDITSNGFKVRTTDATFNTNAGTYIYATFAEHPFAYARAR